MDVISIGTAVGFSVITNLAKKVANEENLSKLTDWVLSVGEHFWKSAEKKLSGSEEPPKLESTNSNATVPSSINLADFTTQRRIKQIAGLMNQLDIYSSNLNRDLERAAKLGGVDSPDMSHKLYNSIQDQKREISQCFIQLTDVIYKLYGENMDELSNFKKLLENQL